MSTAPRRFSSPPSLSSQSNSQAHLKIACRCPPTHRFPRGPVAMPESGTGHIDASGVLDVWGAPW
eukprot:scaffold1087_cov198-Pinguiococcus_pyrenoidosus.AAC.36